MKKVTLTAMWALIAVLTLTTTLSAGEKWSQTNEAFTVVDVATEKKAPVAYKEALADLQAQFDLAISTDGENHILPVPPKCGGGGGFPPPPPPSMGFGPFFDQGGLFSVETLEGPMTIWKDSVDFYHEIGEAEMGKWGFTPEMVDPTPITPEYWGYNVQLRPGTLIRTDGTSSLFMTQGDCSKIWAIQISRSNADQLFPYWGEQSVYLNSDEFSRYENRGVWDSQTSYPDQCVIWDISTNRLAIVQYGFARPMKISDLLANRMTLGNVNIVPSFGDNEVDHPLNGWDPTLTDPVGIAFCNKENLIARGLDPRIVGNTVNVAGVIWTERPVATNAMVEMLHLGPLGTKAPENVKSFMDKRTDVAETRMVGLLSDRGHVTVGLQFSEFGFLEVGVYVVRIDADPFDSYQETSEMDNWVYSTLNILPPCPEPVLPDFTVTDGWTLNQLTGQFQFQASVHNIGEARNQGNIEVGAFIRNLETGLTVFGQSLHFNPIDPGAEAIWPLTDVGILPPGSYNLVIRADLSNSIDELDELNNFEESPFTVEARPTSALIIEQSGVSKTVVSGTVGHEAMTLTFTNPSNQDRYIPWFYLGTTSEQILCNTFTNIVPTLEGSELAPGLSSGCDRHETLRYTPEEPILVPANGQVEIPVLCSVSSMSHNGDSFSSGIMGIRVNDSTGRMVGGVQWPTNPAPVITVIEHGAFAATQSVDTPVDEELAPLTEAPGVIARVLINHESQRINSLRVTTTDVTWGLIAKFYKNDVMFGSPSGYIITQNQQTITFHGDDRVLLSTGDHEIKMMITVAPGTPNGTGIQCSLDQWQLTGQTSGETIQSEDRVDGPYYTIIDSVDTTAAYKQ